jgi:O-antigen/teichoic acid export membrane protein
MDLWRQILGMSPPGWGTGSSGDGRLRVFLNNNIWLATAFALGLVAAALGLLFLLAWLEPSRPKRVTPSRAGPVAKELVSRARPVRARTLVAATRNSTNSRV